MGDGSHFALHQGDSQQQSGASRGGGTMKICIVVEDLKTAQEELRAKGVKINGSIEKGFGFDFLEFEDLEGNPLRFLQYTK